MAYNRPQSQPRTIWSGLINTILLTAVLTAGAAVYWALVY